MKPEELATILTEHAKWLKDEGGKRANLHRAELRGANLGGAELAMVKLYLIKH